MSGRALGLALAALLLALATGFVLLGSGFDLDYVVPRRLAKLGAMAIGGIAVALSSVAFQTLAGNRILTPAIMGYEAVYLLFHASLVLALGPASQVRFGENGLFLLSILLMLAYSFALDRALFRREHGDVGRPLLVGLVLAMVIGTLTQIVQLRLAPGEFAILQGFSQVSFDTVEPARLAWSAAILVGVGLAGWRRLPVLDVLALGRDQAISLGLDHRRQLRFLLALIAILVAVSTSLIGPTAFMGLFVAHVAYALAPSPRHRAILPLACAVAVALFLFAQLMVEHVFDGKTTVGILVNLACGTWFLTLMLRRRSLA